MTHHGQMQGTFSSCWKSVEFLQCFNLLFIGYNITVLRISNNSDDSTAAQFGKQLPERGGSCYAYLKRCLWLFYKRKSLVKDTALYSASPFSICGPIFLLDDSFVNYDLAKVKINIF